MYDVRLLLLFKEKSGVVVIVFFTLTDRASTIPSNIRGCQSGTWSQIGTKVNGSHHGDNPLLWGITRGGCEAYLVTLTDKCSFLCVSGQRGTIAKPMY